MKKRYLYRSIFGVLILIFAFSAFLSGEGKSKQTIETSALSGDSNKKIGWGIKRNNNHEQPDVGSQNKKVLEENEGICLGNKDNKNIYLTFDEGYEAGYTSEILKILKNNNVSATFFLTAHI